jgi:hypothetical protein
MSFTPGPDTVGEIEPLSLWSGQGVALVRKVQPAAEIVREMNEEAKRHSPTARPALFIAIVGQTYGSARIRVAYWPEVDMAAREEIVYATSEEHKPSCARPGDRVSEPKTFKST